MTESATADRASEVLQRVSSGEIFSDPLSPRDREALADTMAKLFPFESLVPDVYADWRPLVADAFRFFAMHLSSERLLPKIREQLNVPVTEPLSARLVAMLSRMPTLQKLAQVVARNRHLEPELREQLTLLEDRVADIDVGDIHDVVAAELGPRMRRYRVKLGEKIAEGSVAIVVRCSWRDPKMKGRKADGVLKVLKPYVREYLDEELELMGRLAAELEQNRERYGLGALAFRAAFEGVRDLLRREIEFPAEQEELVAARRRLSGVSGVRVPEPIPELSTPSITAMSFEAGRKITHFATEEPEERRRIGERVLTAVLLWPLLVPAGEGVVHADPHAGNFLWDADTGQLVILDWALVETLADDDRRQLIRLAASVVLRDESLAIDALRRLCPDRGNRTVLSSSVERAISETICGIPLDRIPRSRDVVRLLDAVARAGVEFPGPLVVMRKVLFTLDGVLDSLGSSGSVESAAFSGALFSGLLKSPAPSLRDAILRVPQPPLGPTDWFDIGWSFTWLPYRLLGLLTNRAEASLRTAVSTR